ncbi:MAG TPA: LysM domain-containing protein, partial [Kofleriaceae bacterium]|nr:LysM domain-containing protein [Kofleriaceae bacterium]
MAAVVAASAPPVRADDGDDTVDYVVKPGDTCYGIAARELGDRSKLNVLHRLNPQLGPLPHHLVAGQILKLPKVSHDADAHLTGTAGIVRFRRPAEAVWDAARRGMELFRAWRVGAEDRSSAEVTFLDADRLQLRENTIVIIYGPEAARARVTPNETVLEEGTLRSRLGELSPTVRVSTPTAIATLAGGSALVGVLAGSSTVANHEGKPVALAGKAGGAVRVAAGMGTRVAHGKR